MAIHLDDKMRETLTYDVALGVGRCHLCSGSFTLRGGKSNLSGVKVKL
jgi:hypothetical protein